MFEGVKNMKKKILLFVAMCLLVLPITTKAISYDKYKTLNLKEALKEEEIAEAFKNYKETDKQATIYLFRGKGCGFCRAFLTFLNSITDEYGKYFKVVSFEVWNDADNKQLLNAVATFLGDDPFSDNFGVPYIVIGDKKFDGYSEAYDEDIKSAIKDLYDSKDRYDVFKEMKEEDLNVTAPTTDDDTTDSTSGETSAYSNTSSGKDISNSEVLIVTFLLFIVNIIATFAYINYENKKVMIKLEEKSKR